MVTVATERHFSTLGDYAEDAARLDVEGFRKQHAEAFLVAPRHCVVTPPSRPTGTITVAPVFGAPDKEPDYGLDSRVYPLKRRPGAIFSFISIGRTANSDVMIPDATLSKLHAVFQQQGDTFTLEDTRSSNGTFMNGERVRGAGASTPLRAGARLRLGALELGFFPAREFQLLVTSAGSRGLRAPTPVVFPVARPSSGRG